MPRSVASHSDNVLMAVQTPQSSSSSSEYNVGVYGDTCFAEPPPVDEGVDIIAVDELQNIPDYESDAPGEKNGARGN